MKNKQPENLVGPAPMKQEPMKQEPMHSSPQVSSLNTLLNTLDGEMMSDDMIFSVADMTCAMLATPELTNLFSAVCSKRDLSHAVWYMSVAGLFTERQDIGSEWSMHPRMINALKKVVSKRLGIDAAPAEPAPAEPAPKLTYADPDGFTLRMFLYPESIFADDPPVEKAASVEQRPDDPE